MIQFPRIPLGVKNESVALQRVIDRTLKKKNLRGAFPYIDYITITMSTQTKHD